MIALPELLNVLMVYVILLGEVILPSKLIFGKRLTLLVDSIEVLRCFGFSETFMNWIASILKSAKISVLTDGSPKGYFSCSRGVRQRDPLSPLLFCLAEDFFNQIS